MRDVVIITRKEAKERGLKRYFTGEPCCREHVAGRKVNNAHCVECNKDDQIKYRQTPAGRKSKKKIVRRHELKMRYGITLDYWNELFDGQDNKCAICATESTRLWATDHCHATNKVRGILCDSCNQGLGRFKDDPTFLRRAADYVEKNK